MLILATLLFSCEREPIEADCSLSPGLYRLSDFPIGVAVDLYQLENNPTYQNLLNQQFNQLTPENIFKADRLHPAEEQYYFTEADRLVVYAETHAKEMHGHNLVWHQQLPNWLKNYRGSKAQWEELFEDHIKTIVGHFKGKLRAWDVVNEPFLDDGNLRPSLWLEHIGPSYIEKAFRYAHEADPEALLFLNDYNMALSPRKRASIIQLVKDLQRRGVPIHGIGLQMHINIVYPSDADIGRCMQEMAELGLALHLSEVDISINPFSRNIDFSPELAQDQAEKMAFVVKAYQSIPAHLQYGITFWGLSDLDSWIPSYFGRNDSPLLFDRSYEPKAMYCQLKSLLP